MAGDEARMMARRTGVPVVTAVDRAEACRVAVAGLAPDCIVLDDGFQHRRLARDLDIVLVDGRERGGRLLPAGPLREPVGALARADVILDSTLAPGTSATVEDGRLRAGLQQRPLALVETVAPDARKRPVAELAGRPVVAVAGIARPERFLAMLEEAGARVVETMIYADHHDYDAGDWREIRAAALGAEFVVTTEKDLVKLAAFGAEPGFLVALRIAAVVSQPELVLDRVLPLVRERGLPPGASRQ